MAFPHLGYTFQLVLHTLVEAGDIDHDPLVRAVADRLLLVVGLDPEQQSAAVDAGQLGGGAHAHSDRRGREVPHVETDAEALMPSRQQVLTAASAAASMTLIMTGVASTGTRPLPTRGAVCSTPTS